MEHALAIVPAARNPEALHAPDIVGAQDGKDLVAACGEVDRGTGFGIGPEGIGTEYGKLVWHGAYLSMRIVPANLPYFCLIAAITRLANSAGLPACQRHTMSRSCSGDTTMSLLPAPSAAKAVAGRPGRFLPLVFSHHR